MRFGGSGKWLNAGTKPKLKAHERSFVDFAHYYFIGGRGGNPLPDTGVATGRG